MINQFLNEAAKAGTGPISEYAIDEDAVELLCRCDYQGNIRSLRNLVYELTSYIDHSEPISLNLVSSVLAQLKHAPCTD
jgi:DNA-binding NtrC family response regulator